MERRDATPTLVFGLDVPREELERRIIERTQAMFEAGVEDEVRRGLGACPHGASRARLDEIARLPRDEAVAAVVLRPAGTPPTSAMDAEIPALIRVEAARPADEVADEILEVARARERLPAH